MVQQLFTYEEFKVDLLNLANYILLEPISNCLRWISIVTTGGFF